MRTALVVILSWVLHNIGVLAMLHPIQHSLRCRLAGSQVIITRQVFRGISGIGDDTPFVQVEQGCSVEETCPHRCLPQCPVRLLDAIS